MITLQRGIVEDLEVVPEVGDGQAAAATSVLFGSSGTI
jgi:hypothetical protein